MKGMSKKQSHVLLRGELLRVKQNKNKMQIGQGVIHIVCPRSRGSGGPLQGNMAVPILYRGKEGNNHGQDRGRGLKSEKNRGRTSRTTPKNLTEFFLLLQCKILLQNLIPNQMDPEAARADAKSISHLCFTLEACKLE